MLWRCLTAGSKREQGRESMRNRLALLSFPACPTPSIAQFHAEADAMHPDAGCIEEGRRPPTQSRIVDLEASDELIVPARRIDGAIDLLARAHHIAPEH